MPEQPFEGTLYGMEGDCHRRVLPEEDVVLEINAHLAQLEMQRGHELAFDVIRHTAKVFVLDPGGQLDGNGHNLIGLGYQIRRHCNGIG